VPVAPAMPVMVPVAVLPVRREDED
jgi:hypothetical protein